MSVYDELRGFIATVHRADLEFRSGWEELTSKSDITALDLETFFDAHAILELEESRPSVVHLEPFRHGDRVEPVTLGGCAQHYAHFRARFERLIRATEAASTIAKFNRGMDLGTRYREMHAEEMEAFGPDNIRRFRRIEILRRLIAETGVRKRDSLYDSLTPLHEIEPATIGQLKAELEGEALGLGEVA